MDLDNSSGRPGLKRELGFFGASMTGVGSIVGTRIFVSVGFVVAIAGPATLLAIVISAAVAVSLLITALTLIGDVKIIWSFNA